jgi:hypothetical protein
MKVQGTALKCFMSIGIEAGPVAVPDDCCIRNAAAGLRFDKPDGCAGEAPGS